MNEKQDGGYVYKTGLLKESSDGVNQNEINSNTEESFEFKDCSDVVKDIFKEANIPVSTESEQFSENDESDDTDYSSAAEDCSDTVCKDSPIKDKKCAEKELSDDIIDETDDDVIHEIGEEQLKETQKAWSDEDIQNYKTEALVLKDEGNIHFKNGKYMESIQSYTEALNTCPLTCSPERAVLYANRAAAKINLEQKEEAVLDCNKAIELNPNYLKALLRRAQLHRKLENLDQCLADYQKILELDKNCREAHEACVVLPQEIAARNEKLKTEMLGKLKDLGNLVLGPFGLSTDNFNLVQDPNSGGYSVNFQNNNNGK